MKSEIRDMAWVPRWSIIRTTRTQSLAEHSFFVTVLIDDMVRYLQSKNQQLQFPHYLLMLKWGLVHDFSETLTGDITGPVKKQIVDHEAYTALCIKREEEMLGWSPTHCFEHVFMPIERAVCDIADKLEALLFIYDELKTGNKLFNLRNSLERTIQTRIEALPAHDVRKLVDDYVGLAMSQNAAESKVNHYPPM